MFNDDQAGRPREARRPGRRMWGAMILAGMAASCLGVAGPAVVSGADRNIVLFVADDLGCDLGCYGHPVVKSPRIDQFAREGTLFRYAFATTASCSASRSVILSGLFNHANAQYGHQHHYHHFSSYDWIKSLPWFLKQAGYRTARVGKYHVAPESVYIFDKNLGGFGRNVVRMVDEARPFITADPDRPFFLYICTSDPHRGGGKTDRRPLAPDRFGNRPNGYPGIERRTYDPKEVVVPPFLPDTTACREELAQYYQSVSRVDQGFGYLLDMLRETGNYDNTLIMLISDHGIAMPGAKTTVYEPGLRSPCIVRLPHAERRGIENSAMISWVDITPTLLDFAGILDRKTSSVAASIATMPPDIHRPRRGKPIPYTFQGRSFLPIIETPRPKGWDEVYASHTFHEIQMYYPMRVVRERRYKLIWNIAYPLPYPFASDLWAASTWQAQWRQGPEAMYGKRTVDQYVHRAQFELYDLESDPDESHNLAGDPKYAELLQAMKDKLKAFQRRTQDPWILKWDYE